MHHRQLLLTMRYLSVHCQLWGAAGSLACAACTNAIPGVTYYYGGQGTFYPNTCPTQPCAVFGNGYYNAGCGRTSAGSPAASSASVYQFIGAACI